MMKLRTTSVSFASFAWRTLAILLVIGVATVVFLQMTRPTSADQYQERINALQADMAEYQAEANRLSTEASTLANAVAQLANQRQALQTQIDLNQVQYNKLSEQIVQTEKEIKDNQDALGVTIANLYVDDSISPIEMLASSKNINDFLDKQEYRNAIRDELGSTIKRVRELKNELTEKKTAVEQVLNDQKTARETLVARENEQNTLLSQTRNDEANYQSLIKDSAQKIAEARRLQAEMNSRSNQTGGYKLIQAGSLGAYPWNSSNCYVDVNALSHGGSNGNGGDGYGYGCRQCTSYVAWRVAQETGRYYQNWGNGGSFANSAINAGYQNLGRNPQPGSLAVMWGNPGHVAWVEGVSADGTQVTISQYNWNYGAGWGMYSVMTLSTGFFDQYVKIN